MLKFTSLKLGSRQFVARSGSGLTSGWPVANLWLYRVGSSGWIVISLYQFSSIETLFSHIHKIHRQDNACEAYLRVVISGSIVLRMRRETPSPVCYKRVHVDSKIKYTEFYNICVLMFMHYTVCYFTGIFYAVVRQISMLVINNEDSVFCILYSVGYSVFCTRKKR